jgi:hypothetical protein
VIVEAITLISTANAAIGAVKEFVSNGRDLMDCGKELGQYFDAKSEIQKKADRNGSGSDLELFFELEKLKQQEEELKQMMIYSGRGGMWDDWLAFQAGQKRKRDDAAKQARAAKLKKQAKIKEAMLIGVIILTATVGFGAIIALFIWLAQQRR